MSISGLVVHADPARREPVGEALRACPGADIHASTEDGIFIITVDRRDDREAADAMMDFRHIDGVLSTSLVYHNIESDILKEETTS